MALYIASDEPITGPSWTEASPAFNVQALTESEGPVTRQFSKPHLAYLGAHTGCSCGFSYGQSDITSEEDATEDRQARRSVASLRAFLEDVLCRQGEVELYACWEGDQSADPVERLSITPAHFGGESFDLPEKVYFRVRKAAEQADAAG